MHKLLDALTSPFVGFLIKCIAGVATAYFGLIGIGAKTREDDGSLTPKGRLALIGFLVSGTLALGSVCYDYFSAQKAARNELEKSQRLLLSVERGIYPLRNINGDITFNLSKDSKELSNYRAFLVAKLPKKAKSCAPTAEYSCGDRADDGTIGYVIPPKSPLFPKLGSQTAVVLSNLGAEIDFVKLNPKEAKTQYTRAGNFYFLPHNDGGGIITFDPDNFAMQYTVNRFTIPDSDTMKAGIYSLAEVFPGFVGIQAAMVDKSICSNCFRPVTSEHGDGTTIQELVLRFPYPKTLRLNSVNDFECRSYDNDRFSILTLPDDIEQLSEVGNINVATTPQNYRSGLCKAYSDPGF